MLPPDSFLKSLHEEVGHSLSKWIFFISIFFLLAGCETQPPKESAVSRSLREQREEWEKVSAEKKAKQDRDDAENKRRTDSMYAQWAAEAKAKIEERDRFLNSHPDINPEFKDAILNQRFMRGMTMEEVEFAVGKPRRKNVSENAFGRQEQWVYDGGSTYLYFDQGILTSWQQSSGN